MNDCGHPTDSGSRLSRRALRHFLAGMTIISMLNTASATVFAQRPEVQKFIDDVTQQHKLDKHQTINAFSQIEPSEEVLLRMTTQYEALPWHKYKTLLVTDKRIKGGKEFLNEHSVVLKRAEHEFGVPAAVIVAIIGIESSYNQNSGKYPVLQTLATLAFDYPPRADFFKNELKEYLLLITEQGLDPLALKGSYAGAMGIPQFIASSYRNFAVDFDNSGQIDLHNNIPQVIGSIANYFKIHGWQPGQDVAHRAVTKGQKYKDLPLAKRSNPQPALPIAKLKQHGVTAPKIKNPDVQVAFIEFDNGKNPEYWLGMQNFYVITRYNNSSNYALAVHHLSEAIVKPGSKTNAKLGSKPASKTAKTKTTRKK